MSEINFYNWQLDAFNYIKDKSAVLSAPTGSGKTLAAYLWAGILDLNGNINKEINCRRIIFTAPIKALSNERYLDLRRMGLDVGLETGDFKRNTNADIICCTQEIYTMKYAHVENQKLIVDEFHYIFDDSDRARMYIDGIKATHETTQILVMSATLGGVREVGKYLENLCGREFEIYESHERATKLIFTPDKPAKISNIHDALVFVFSQKGAERLALSIAQTREKLDENLINRLNELAEILDINNFRNLEDTLTRGVGTYHGGMLPKEKLLVESAFRERILDVVCGTNALALGVNLPAQYVIFAQLVQYHAGRPITKNEFLQMAGRAGRKGLFDPGYVTYLKKSPFEFFGADTGKIFKALVKKKSEKAVITLRPSFGRLLRKQTLPEFEAEYIADYSLPEVKAKDVLRGIKFNLRKIDRVASEVVQHHSRKKFHDLLADIWYDEMEVEENLEMALLFFEESSPSALMAAQMVMPYERNFLQALLKVKRFANQLPKGYYFRPSSMTELNNKIDEIDPTIYGFEEKLNEIEFTREA